MIKLTSPLSWFAEMFRAPAKRKPAVRGRAKFHYMPTPVTPHPKRGYSEFCVYGRRTERNAKSNIGWNVTA